MSFAADFGGFFIFMLNYQVHIFHSFAVFRAGGNDINSSCVDTAVTENIRKFCNIFFDAVKCSCEQVAKIMRKYLLRIDICIFAQGFHLSPNVRAVYGFAVFRYKNHTAFYSLLCCIAEQFLFQFFHDRVFALQFTIASPHFVASIVIYCNSLTRIPVAQIV